MTVLNILGANLPSEMSCDQLEKTLNKHISDSPIVWRRSFDYGANIIGTSFLGIYEDVFTQYSQGGFGWDEQVRTAEWLAQHRGPVVLSNQATPRILRLYRKLGYQLVKLNAPRRISCTGDRSQAKEVLALRNLG